MAISSMLAEQSKHLVVFISIPDDQSCLCMERRFYTCHLSLQYTTNTWSSRMQMNAPRCLFGSTSVGEIYILAGETGTWKTLPSMNKWRKMCFVDGNFYVIGGIGRTELSKVLLTHCGD
ncbi:hypothetical protein H5410_019440 [Solanum commersonii]|uniref:F-box/kelch-repeat protein n=1 Tax=Solanum commersonii TaxID=4109 RepID=A0A9J5Z8D4_SOLCO|nr:hypothetical protein H5410_019440 [Solanum commersonii]